MHFHAISGCDTTSYFYRAGKTTPFRKAVDENKMHLISSLGNDIVISQECIDNCLEFIRTILYNGKEKESYLETRIRLYDRQDKKSKTTMNIPPDIDSCIQHIRRCHLRIFIWTNCDKQLIPHISTYDNGWRLSECKAVLPVWFTGPQFPPSCVRQKTL